MPFSTPFETWLATGDDIADADQQCGVVDPMTGAVCSRTEHTDKRHSDLSDPGCMFLWNHEPDFAALLIQDLGG